jgi:hypothetical protein
MKKITLSLPNKVWGTIIHCIPNHEIMNPDAMEDVIHFMSAYKKETERIMKPIQEEEDPDS